MSLREIDGLPGAPWDRPMAGTLDRLTVESELLAGNPLGDPARRPLYVYRPPGVAAEPSEELPAVYVIQGFTGQLDSWLGRSTFEPTFIERLDAMFAGGECPDAVIVLVDAWTSRGGSQFLNSSSTGRYQDYLCDEVVPFIDARYPTLSDRDHRGISGKSSGGYGAMVVPMFRPDVFGALASHAGDALFECCYQPEFPLVARALRDHFDGSWETFRERLAAADHFDFGLFGPALNAYGMGCAYSPDPDRPGEALLPFEIETGRLKPRRLGAMARRRSRAHGAAAEPTRCGACGASTWMPDAPTNGFSISVRRPSPANSQARRGVHAGSVRGWTRGHHLPVPWRDPGACPGPGTMRRAARR